MTELIRYPVPEVVGFAPKKHEDARGSFSEVFKTNWLETIAPGVVFNQDNHAASVQAGTLRGLHFQYGKATQAKLVRCIRGAILDVAIDIRRGSPSYGQHVAVTLSAENWQQLFIPHGFAHGYRTLLPNTEVLYKVDRLYDPEREGVISWCDPDLAIDWSGCGHNLVTSDQNTPDLDQDDQKPDDQGPDSQDVGRSPGLDLIISEKDRTAPPLSQRMGYFSYRKGAGPFNVICHDPDTTP